MNDLTALRRSGRRAFRRAVRPSRRISHRPESPRSIRSGQQATPSRPGSRRGRPVPRLAGEPGGTPFEAPFTTDLEVRVNGDLLLRCFGRRPLLGRSLAHPNLGYWGTPTYGPASNLVLTRDSTHYELRLRPPESMLQLPNLSLSVAMVSLNPNCGREEAKRVSGSWTRAARAHVHVRRRAHRGVDSGPERPVQVQHHTRCRRRLQA